MKWKMVDLGVRRVKIFTGRVGSGFFPSGRVGSNLNKIFGSIRVKIGSKFGALRVKIESIFDAFEVIVEKPK